MEKKHISPKNDCTPVEIELPIYIWNILERKAEEAGLTLQEYICNKFEDYFKQLYNK